MNDKDWEGKVLLAYVRSPGAILQNGIAIIEAHFEEIRGRIFIVGNAPDDPRDWISGLPVIVSWDDVIHLVVVGSLEEYFQRLEKAPFPTLPPGSEGIH